jgi:hypothetical protein
MVYYPTNCPLWSILLSQRSVFGLYVTCYYLKFQFSYMQSRVHIACTALQKVFGQNHNRAVEEGQTLISKFSM